MESNDSFSIHEIGSQTGETFSGTFTVKLSLTRADQFAADQRRREILGPRPNDALEALKLEAFMLGQLSVRIVKAPKFWTNSNGGLLLEDFNVVQLVYNEALRLEEEHVKAIQEETEATLKHLVQREKEKEADEQPDLPPRAGSRS